MLKEKERNILNLIVESYLKLGKPVSSGYIVQKKGVTDSPATIRNIMAKLEDFGYLTKPHASAGRIPTDRGLRLYVNSLLEESPFSGEHVRLIPGDFSLEEGDFNSLFDQVSRILAEYSDNLGFVLSPQISRIQFHHLRFIKIAEDKVLIILITAYNLVLTEIVQAAAYFTQTELDRTSQYVNQSFRGKNLLFVRDYLLSELPRYKIHYEDILNKLITLLKTYFNQEEKEGKIFLQGASKLIDKAELFDADKLRSLFQNFEEKAKLARLLSDFIALDRVKVLIGTETNIPAVSDCSLILSHYGYDNQVLGSLGIIGPKRIPYDRIIPLVDHVAKRLSQRISHNQ